MADTFSARVVWRGVELASEWVGAGITSGITAPDSIRESTVRGRMRNPNKLKRAIHHVVYEYANLISSGTLLSRPLKPPCNTHVQDAFLLSCRKLADFFLNRSKQDDVMACHYFTKNPVPKFKLTEWAAWKKAMDKQLAHITYNRVDYPESWDGSKNEALFNEFRQAWRLFLSGLEARYKTEFDTQIDKRRTAPGFGDLDLR